MTIAPNRPTLPITPVNRHGSRSRMTCLFRCGNACDHPEPNQSENGHIQQEITRALQRRSVLKGAAIGSGALVLGGAAATASSGLAAAAVGEPASRAVVGDLAKASFAPVAPNKRDSVTVAEGFTHSVVMRWGDPVVAGAPAFDARNQSVGAAQMQFGYNCDYVGLLPIGRDQALLVVNHEYTDENLMFPANTYSAFEIKAIAMSNHGMSVVTLKRGLVPGDWQRVKDLGKAKHNRRIHIDTPFAIVGPAAGDDRLKTVADPTGRVAKGTLNNCAGGMTPWGTVLSGEENFNQYFDKSGALDSRYTAEYARYGVTGTGSKGWSEVDSRFDLTEDPHEPHRFGWIVEVDPTQPRSTPRKHTMLGRLKHEGANIVIAPNGRAVAYMGDDERGDYIYRFVSADRFDPAKTAKARRHNLTLLTKGTLSVAKLVGDGSTDGEYDGTGSWIPLCTDTTSYVPGMSVADVLIFTRLAADKMGPTKMDRPEDVEPNLVNGKVYAALTNNSNRGSAAAPVDEANPLASSMVRSALGAPLTSASGNRNGYVLELTPVGGHAASTFTWDLLLICGDPAAAETYFGGVDKSTVSPISCPDNVTFDTEGQLWISTDGNVLGSNDGIFRVPTSGPLRGQVRQFVTMPRGAEACGPLIADSNRSLFFAVQHPGEIDGATFENQASTWPHTDDFPRPSVCVAYERR